MKWSSDTKWAKLVTRGLVAMLVVCGFLVTGTASAESNIGETRNATSVPSLSGGVATNSDSVAVPLNEPVWTRTCDRGYGLEIWNNNDPQNCSGTMTYYYYNVAKVQFNMAAYLAASSTRDPNLLFQKLDAWCGNNPILCAISAGIVQAGVTLIFKWPI